MCLLALGLREEVMACRWLDGMLLWKHAVVEPEYEMTRNEKQHFKLKGPGGCVSVLGGDGDYGEGIDFHDPSPEARAALQAYNDLDTKHTFDGAQHWWERLTPKQQRVALIEAESLPLIAAANLEGMLIDTLACKTLRASLHQTAAEKLAILGPVIEPIAVRRWPKIVRDSAKKGQSVTESVVRSPQKLKEVLFDEWKYPILKTNTSKATGEESNSTDKEVLHELAILGHDNAKHIHHYRQALNRCTKFADNPLESVDYNADGQSRPQAFVFSTYSGRLTYGSTQGKKGTKAERQIGWAVHQEKRDKNFRDIVTAPPGYTLAEFDAAGQEYRWMGVQSRDETMLQLCMPGEKPHAFMGARTIDMDYKEFLVHYARNEIAFIGPQGYYMLGKVSNLSLQYRTSPKRLCSTARTDYEFDMTMPQAQHAWSVYQRTYERVPKYWTQQIDLAKRQGYVETLAGRRVKVVGDWSGKLGWAMGSTAINYPVQGTGADQKYLALAVVRPYCEKHGIRFMLDMHDGLYFLIPDEFVDEAAPTIKRMLDNLPYKQAWGVDLPIPMPWDCKVGRSWGQLTEWRKET